MRTKLLFVCSRNQWRSPTAEAMFKRCEGYEARSAGTSSSARTRVNEGHIDWADEIFVMEKRHRDVLRQQFSAALAGKPVCVLDIPDEFQFMDPDLIDLLRQQLASHGISAP